MANPRGLAKPAAAEPLIPENFGSSARACRGMPDAGRAGLHAPGFPRREIKVASVALAAEYNPFLV